MYGMEIDPLDPLLVAIRRNDKNQVATLLNQTKDGCGNVTFWHIQKSFKVHQILLSQGDRLVNRGDTLKNSLEIIKLLTTAQKKANVLQAGSSMLAMKQNNSILQDLRLLPQEIVTHIAWYCWPKEKNALMRVCESFCDRLKDRTSILLANPSTISLLDKIDATVEYARSGNTYMIELLIKHGVKANDKNILGITPFHMARDNNHVQAMQLLIAHGADVNLLKPEIQPLDEATYEGNKDMVQTLLALEVNPSLSLATPLNIASWHGRTEIVALLLKHGTNVNQAGVDGWTALNIASRRGHIGIVELLLNHGANVNQENNMRQTPLKNALKNGYTEIIELLLAHGADVNHRNNKGQTPLYVESFNNHVDIVRFLLKKTDAKVNLADADGNTPLHCAASQGHIEIVKLLLYNLWLGEENQKNKQGNTPLHLASMKGHVEVVNLLLNAGADVNQRNNNGKTPLRLAQEKGYANNAAKFQSIIAKLQHSELDLAQHKHSLIMYLAIAMATLFIQSI